MSRRSPQPRAPGLTVQPAQQQDDGHAADLKLIELVRALARQQALADHEAEYGK